MTTFEEQQFEMIENLTEELGEKESKIIELEKMIEVYRTERIIQADREFVKTTFIKYCKTFNYLENDDIYEVCEYFEEHISNYYPSNYPSDYHKVFVMMLYEILDVKDYDLKSESEIRDDFKYEVGEEEYEEKWKDDEIDDIIFHLDYETNVMYYKLPFDNEDGEKVWWLIS